FHHLPGYPSIHPSIHLPIHHSYTSTHLSIHPSSTYPRIHLLTFPPTNAPTRSFIYPLSTHSFTHQSIHPSSIYPSPIPGRTEKPQSAGRARRSQAQGNRGCVGSARRTIN
ncbi:hypothetical protein EI555_003349, partial [Monodon monoceros]